MARKARRRGSSRPPAAPPPLTGGHVREEDGWIVRSVSGTAATKAYRCPRCQQEIPPGTPHVVVWPAGDPAGDGAQRTSTHEPPPGSSDARRHWHTHCWARR